MDMKTLSGIQRLWLASIGMVFLLVLFGGVNLVLIFPLPLAYFIGDITNFIGYWLYQNGFNPTPFVSLTDAIAVSIFFGVVTYLIYFVSTWVIKGFNQTGNKE